MLTPYTKEWLSQLCEKSFSYREVLLKAGRKISGGNYSYLKKKIQEYNIDTSHFKKQGWAKGKTMKNDFRITSREKFSLSEIFVQNSQFDRKTAREYLKRHNIIPYVCAFCGNDGHWLNMEISLELDHINGVNNDHRISNLRWLCPNCHATTDTYCGRNIKKQKNINFCIDCGKEIAKQSKRCHQCEGIFRKNNSLLPVSREELKTLIRTTPFTKIGFMYNVSDNAVRKWCTKLSLPHRVKDIKQYTDEEWDKL